MAQAIEFHFDFISPYAWPGAVEIEKVAARHGREVRWMPMLLGISVGKAMGVKPLLETPLKGDYIRHDVPRVYRYLGLNFRPAVPAFVTSPLAPARIYCWMRAQDPARAHAAAREMLEVHWTRAVDVSRAENAAAIAARHGFDEAAALAAPGDPDVKALLNEATADSLSKGVFGSPTFVVDGELFWGADRAPMVDRWLETGGF